MFGKVALRAVSEEAGTAPTRRKPNILLLISDDLRNQLGGVPGFDDGGGLVKTPNLAALAAKSTVFTHAYAQLALCAPSRNSFMSGRRPDVTKAWQFVDHFREAAVQGEAWIALPQHFKRHGYTVVGTGKVYHRSLPPNWDLAYSWDERMANGTWQGWMYPTEPRCPGGKTWCAVSAVDRLLHRDAGRLQDDATVQQAIALLRNLTGNLTATHKKAPPSSSAAAAAVSSSSPHLRPATAATAAPAAAAAAAVPASAAAAAAAPAESPPAVQPWFLAVGFRKPHLQWRVPAEFLDAYPEDLDEVTPLAEGGSSFPASAPDLAFHMPVNNFLLAFNDTQACGSAALDLSADRGWRFPPRCAAAWRRAYWASVSYMDDCVGKVLGEVARLGAADDTVVVFLGDHGFHLGDLGLWEKFTVFEAAVRTPLLVHVPPSLLSRGLLLGRGQEGEEGEEGEVAAKAEPKEAEPKEAEPKEAVRALGSPGRRRRRRRRPVVHDLVELVDVYPTLVELLGMDHHEAGTGGGASVPPLDGKSLVPLLTLEDNDDDEGGKEDKDEAKEDEDEDEEGERVALSQFPRCLNGLDYSSLPLSHEDAAAWAAYGQGQPAPASSGPPPSLPAWDLNGCNGVARSAFTHMGLSLRTQSPDCARGWRLTVWYDWDGDVLAPRWESGHGPGAAVELYAHHVQGGGDAGGGGGGAGGAGGAEHGGGGPSGGALGWCAHGDETDSALDGIETANLAVQEGGNQDGAARKGSTAALQARLTARLEREFGRWSKGGG